MTPALCFFGCNSCAHDFYFFILMHDLSAVHVHYVLSMKHLESKSCFINKVCYHHLGVDSISGPQGETIYFSDGALAISIGDALKWQWTYIKSCLIKFSIHIMCKRTFNTNP